MLYLFYNYRITDTVVIDKNTCYQIKVWPKIKQDLAFTGTIWIADSTYALKQLDLEITKDVNINLIEHLSIQQELETTPTGEHVCKKMNLLVDGANLTKNFVSFIQNPPPIMSLICSVTQIIPFLLSHIINGI